MIAPLQDELWATVNTELSHFTCILQRFQWWFLRWQHGLLNYRITIVIVFYWAFFHMLEFIFSYFPLQLRDAYVQSLPQRRCDVICVWNLGLRVNFQNRLFLEFIDNIWPKSASTARGQESESPQDPDKWHFLAQKGEKLKSKEYQSKSKLLWISGFQVPHMSLLPPYTKVFWSWSHKPSELPPTSLLD